IVYASHGGNLLAIDIGSPSQPEGFNIKYYLGAVRMHWHPPSSDGGSPIIEYRIYRKNAPSWELDLIGTVAGYQTSFADRDIVKHEFYHYSICAVNEYGESERIGISIRTEDPTLNDIFAWIYLPAFFISIIILAMVYSKKKK
ncbi:MAG TPA: fibronectin type III domain-containing protein, partial [Methanomassiliicoccales archaeon]|nr:fibronectin type III domain-containing protein [Methanomassiliicoccales archaeon]